MADAYEWEDLPEPDPRPVQFVGHQYGMSEDARRMGLDRNTEEGALVAMAGSLNAAKPSHRLVAWILLAAFCVPLLLTLYNEFF